LLLLLLLLLVVVVVVLVLQVCQPLLVCSQQANQLNRALVCTCRMDRCRSTQQDTAVSLLVACSTARVVR
jgi:hypothetical protein